LTIRTSSLHPAQHDSSQAEKSALQRAAALAGLDVSAYVLGRVRAPAAQEFAEVLARIGQGQTRFALAELNALLTRLTGPELREAVEEGPRKPLDPYWSNYIAAMVEQACERQSITVPGWVSQTPSLAEPVFGSTLQSLRLYLLTHSPAPFRRRNIFIDASINAQV
jgi:uncharacterized protein (DUF1778 family)